MLVPMTSSQRTGGFQRLGKVLQRVLADIPLQSDRSPTEARRAPGDDSALRIDREEERGCAPQPAPVGAPTCEGEMVPALSRSGAGSAVKMPAAANAPHRLETGADDDGHSGKVARGRLGNGRAPGGSRVGGREGTADHGYLAFGMMPSTRGSLTHCATGDRSRRSLCLRSACRIEV